jgi:beta-lactamase regulating signal transducer with metallopeptidase domain
MIEILLCWLGWSLCLSLFTAFYSKRQPQWQRWPALYSVVALCSVLPCLPFLLLLLLGIDGAGASAWLALVQAGLAGLGIETAWLQGFSWLGWSSVLPQLGDVDDLAPSLLSAHAGAVVTYPLATPQDTWAQMVAQMPAQVAALLYGAVLIALLRKRYVHYRLWQRFKQLRQPYPSDGAVWQMLQQDPSLHQLWRQAGSPQVFWHPLPGSPFVAGMVNAQLYLPIWFSQLSPMQQQLLLRHEFQHLVAKHPQKLLLWQLASLLAWFNPCVAFWAQRYQQAIELEVDQHVITQTGKARSYAELLLLISTKPQQSPAYFTLAALGAAPITATSRAFNMLQQRISAMRSPTLLSRPQRWGLVGLFSLSSTLLALSAGLFGVIYVSGVSANAAPSQLLHAQPVLPPWLQGPAQWRHPLPQAYVSSPFGKISALRDFKAHRGIDLVAPRGSAILAIAAGRVLVADANTLKPSLGLTVVIAHHGGYQSLFAHMDRIDVQVGDWVDAGQIIGTLGNSGRTTGPHLHMELAHGNRHIDPAAIVNIANRSRHDDTAMQR